MRIKWGSKRDPCACTLRPCQTLPIHDPTPVAQAAMEAELVAVTRQFGLLKEGYSKARDNLRAEQSVRRAVDIDEAPREVSQLRIFSSVSTIP